jgi:hypothetical protein
VEHKKGRDEMIEKRKKLKSVKIYFAPQDEDLYNSLKAVADKTRLSLSMVGFLMLESGLPRAEDALKVFQNSRKGKKISK